MLQPLLFTAYITVLSRMNGIQGGMTSPIFLVVWMSGPSLMLFLLETGDQNNLFVSARELALWGYLHLNKGYVNNQQIIPEAVFERITSVQTPNHLPAHLPRQG